MGLFNVLGSLQNLESAEAAGDRYPVRSSMLINGIGTIAAAALGSCFPTSLYIGHPGWKAMGARIGYSWLNGLVIGGGCLLGLFGLVGQLVPIEAGMAIVLYIGLVMVAQAFQATPAAHAPAVALGMLPGLAGWGSLLLKAGLRAGGAGSAARPFGPGLLAPLQQADVWAAGAFALEQGQIITAMLLAAPWLIGLMGWRGGWWTGVMGSALLLLVVLRVFPGSGRASAAPQAASSLLHGLRVATPWLLAGCFAIYTLQWMAMMVWLPTFLYDEFQFGLGQATVIVAVVNRCQRAGQLAGWLPVTAWPGACAPDSGLRPGDGGDWLGCFRR